LNAQLIEVIPSGPKITKSNLLKSKFRIYTVSKGKMSKENIT
jgi:hypothetical protein